jgi:uncharacterized protein YecT (DUF1311 family)
MLLGGFVHAQDACEFASEKASTKLETNLRKAPSCKLAAKRYGECRWGSSADLDFSSIVITKCERDFLSKLTPAGRAHYRDQMEMCGYRYHRQSGTIHISEASSCRVDVAVLFATYPEQWEKAIPHASFNCSLAKTPLEQAICSDNALGRADRMLSIVYHDVLRWSGKTIEEKIRANQRAWLGELPKRCSITDATPSQTSLECLRNAMEIRFSMLDNCAEEDGVCKLKELSAEAEKEFVEFEKECRSH